jgi:hypothetical protein
MGSRNDAGPSVDKKPVLETLVKLLSFIVYQVNSVRKKKDFPHLLLNFPLRWRCGKNNMIVVGVVSLETTHRNLLELLGGLLPGLIVQFSCSNK